MTRRDEVVARVRLRLLFEAVSAVHVEGDAFMFRGDDREGLLFAANGEGDHHVIAWNAAGVVALAFEHDWADGQQNLEPDDRTPEALVADAPSELAPLVEEAARASSRLATGGLWICGARSASDGTTDALAPYLADEADARVAWLAATGLTEEHGALAQRLLDRSRGGAFTLDAADEAALLAPPDPRTTVSAAKAARGARLLVQVGIVWSDAAAAGRRAAERARDEVAGALGPLNTELFRAVLEGRVDAVGDLLRRGADAGCSYPVAPLGDLMQGETPLIVAARRGWLEIVDLLLAAGASPNVAPRRRCRRERSGTESRPCAGWRSCRSAFFLTASAPPGSDVDSRDERAPSRALPLRARGGAGDMGDVTIRVGVIMGGSSGEREVSLRSGAAVASALEARGHHVVRVELPLRAEEAAEAITAAKIDVAFLALHGRMGEDGCIQGLLELAKIPYTGSGVLTSALAMDKLKAKELFRLHNVPTPPYYAVHVDDDRTDLASLHGSFGFPVVVKPRGEGSSLGVKKAHDLSELEEALDHAFEFDDCLLVERYVAGMEVNVGILDGRVLGAIEIAPGSASGMYDYEAKYTPGMTEYFMPARLPKARLIGISNLAERAAAALGCTGAVRVDLLVTAGENEYVLEVNTLPGMTETSLLPKIAAASGLPFAELCEAILASARLHAPARKSRVRSGEFTTTAALVAPVRAAKSA